MLSDCSSTFIIYQKMRRVSPRPVAQPTNEKAKWQQTEHWECGSTRGWQTETQATLRRGPRSGSSSGSHTDVTQTHASFTVECDRAHNDPGSVQSKWGSN